ncbi:hypothetical protein [Kribbella aluminosa]|uniref:hypothetical protein n=1 Tax=Kribbella aluminosa TaxID=416017 RepID=UPI0031D0D339
MNSERSAMVYEEPENPYAQTYLNFLNYTAGHELTVVHDDGLYRHLRMRDPQMGGIWSWDVVTWPGHLATSGDLASGFVFARIEDMLDFFNRAGHRSHYSDGAPSIDFAYWAEKIVGRDCYHGVRKYSHNIFVRYVTHTLQEDSVLGVDAQIDYEKTVEIARRVTARNGVHYEDYLEHQRQNSSLAHLDIDGNSADEEQYFGLPIPETSPADRRQELIDDACQVESRREDAHQWLNDHDDCLGQDTWEWDLSDYDTSFITACYALDKTVQAWTEHLAANAEAASPSAAHTTPIRIQV